MLFLLVAEDRALLHLPEDSEAALKAHRRYREFDSLARLGGFSRHRAGTPHPDLWHVFQFVTSKLGSYTDCPELALPPLGNFRGRRHSPRPTCSIASSPIATCSKL